MFRNVGIFAHSFFGILAYKESFQCKTVIFMFKGNDCTWEKKLWSHYTYVIIDWRVKMIRLIWCWVWSSLNHPLSSVITLYLRREAYLCTKITLAEARKDQVPPPISLTNAHAPPLFELPWPSEASNAIIFGVITLELCDRSVITVKYFYRAITCDSLCNDIRDHFFLWGSIRQFIWRTVALVRFITVVIFCIFASII